MAGSAVRRSAWSALVAGLVVADGLLWAGIVICVAGVGAMVAGALMFFGNSPPGLSLTQAAVHRHMTDVMA